MLSATACSTFPTKYHVVVSDNFERGTRSSAWQAEAAFDYSINIAPSPEKPGKSIRFEWRKEDWAGHRGTKGGELKTVAFPDMPEQRLSMSFYIDNALLPVDTKPFIIMQYHSIPDLAYGEQWRHPITALAYQNGELVYSFRNSRSKITEGEKGLWQYDSKGQLPLGKPHQGWNHLTLHQRFDVFDRKGRIDITLNGQIFSAKNISLGYNDRKGPFLKLGLYCPQSSAYERLVILFDDIKLENMTVAP